MMVCVRLLLKLQYVIALCETSQTCFQTLVFIRVPVLYSQLLNTRQTTAIGDLHVFDLILPFYFPMMVFTLVCYWIDKSHWRLTNTCDTQVNRGLLDVKLQVCCVIYMTTTRLFGQYFRHHLDCIDAQYVSSIMRLLQQIRWYWFVRTKYSTGYWLSVKCTSRCVLYC